MLKKISRLGAGVTATFALAALGSGTPAAFGKSCSTGYTSAYIHGEHECLRAGEYCSRRYERQYLHYHYTCVVVRGVYRLEHT
jgi:hypothetical protein